MIWGLVVALTYLNCWWTWADQMSTGAKAAQLLGILIGFAMCSVVEYAHKNKDRTK